MHFYACVLLSMISCSIYREIGIVSDIQQKLHAIKIPVTGCFGTSLNYQLLSGKGACSLKQPEVKRAAEIHYALNHYSFFSTKSWVQPLRSLIECFQTSFKLFTSGILCWFVNYTRKCVLGNKRNSVKSFLKQYFQICNNNANINNCNNYCNSCDNTSKLNWLNHLCCNFSQFFFIFTQA